MILLLERLPSLPSSPMTVSWFNDSLIPQTLPTQQSTYQRVSSPLTSVDYSRQCVLRKAKEVFVPLGHLVCKLLGDIIFHL